MQPSATRVAAAFVASRTNSVTLMEEIKTPRMGEIYEIEVEWRDFHGEVQIESVSWHTEDEQGHSAPYRDFLQQTGLKSDDFERLVEATLEYRYDEWRESRMAAAYTERQYLGLIKRLSGGDSGMWDGPRRVEDVRSLDVSRKSGGHAVWFSAPYGWLPFKVYDDEILKRTRGKVTANQFYSWLSANGAKVKGKGGSKPIMDRGVDTGYTIDGTKVKSPSGDVIGHVSKAEWGYDIYKGKRMSERFYEDTIKSHIGAIRKLIRLHEGKSR